ncbi:MAG TPA: YihY family inner membrane protein [Stellaceae bacterium]
MSTRPALYLQAGLARLRTLAAFIRYTIATFVGDGCLAGAGALSYATLIALVPVTAIALAVLSAVPVFADKRDALLATLFQAFVPEVSGEVEWWFRYFAGTSVRTTTIGVLALAVTVVLLLATIEDQLHHIWRVQSHRPWMQRILAYWAILTLGPLLLGVSFSLPGYIGLFARNAGLAAYEPNGLWDDPVMRGFLRAVPFLLETIVFTLVYELIPNCLVRWREAFFGALVAAALLEGLKSGFVLYVSYLSTYRAVYGALAAIPIFLLWMYVAWSAVLFGAVVAAALPQWRIDQHAKDVKPAAHRLGLGLAFLAELAAQTRQGGTLPTLAIAERLGIPTTAVDDDLSLLRHAGFVAAAADGGWVLARSLEGATLMDLYRALGLPLATSLREEGGLPWQGRIAAALQRIAGAERDALALPLSELVGPGAPVAPFPHPSRHRRP